MRHGNLLASIDAETTGTDARFHEVIQVGIVILDKNLNPTGQTFSHDIRPEHPERADKTASAVHGLSFTDLEQMLSAEKVADLLTEWVASLGMPSGRKLIPLAHNHIFEFSFLSAWLGKALYGELFGFHPRDSMILALSLNDKALLEGKPVPFESVSLTNLAKQFGIVNLKAHDALEDARTAAAVYKHLLIHYVV